MIKISNQIRHAYLSRDLSSNNYCVAGDALITFKEALTYEVDSFESWPNLSTNSNPCTWEYVYCDGNGRVQVL